MKTVILGLPGTGKTTYLLKKMEDIPPSEVIFISYTRSAIREARDRVTLKWGMQYVAQLNYIRTIHSLCSFLLGLEKTQFLPQSWIIQFMNEKGIKYVRGNEINVNDEAFGSLPDFTMPDGNKILGIIDKIRHMELLNIPENREDRFLIVNKYSDGIVFENRQLQDIEYLCDVIREYEVMKQGTLDYTDILMSFLSAPINPGKKYLIVDEFQDLTPLTYAVIKKMESFTTDQFYAGDPNQAIFTFMGASPKFFDDERSTCNNFVFLDRSYRLSKSIWDFASSIIQKSVVNYNYSELKTRDGGEIGFVNKEDVISHMIKVDRPTFLLCRTNKDRRVWENTFVQTGIVFGVIGRGERVWTDKLIHINNLISTLPTGQIDRLSAFAFLDDLPAKPYLKRGISTRAKKNQLFTGNGEKIDISDFFAVFEDQWVNKIPEMVEALRIDSTQKEALKTKLSRNPAIITKPLILTLSTIHASKGMERDIVVYDATLNQRITIGIIEREEVMQDEARLAYTAVTRAKDQVMVFGQNKFTKNYLDVSKL